jgi:hypothetical protein
MLYKTVETVYTHQFKFMFFAPIFASSWWHCSRVAVRMRLVNVNYHLLRDCSLHAL